MVAITGTKTNAKKLFSPSIKISKKESDYSKLALYWMRIHFKGESNANLLKKTGFHLLLSYWFTSTLLLSFSSLLG